MGRFWLVLLAVMLQAGCGAAYKSEASYAPSPSGYGEMGGASPAPEMAMEEREANDGYVEKKADYAGSPGAAAPVTPSVAAQPPAEPKHEPSAAKTESPLVVYTAHLRLRVKRLLEAVEAITSLAKKRSGYIESMSQTLVVVRVPATNFDETVAKFASLGKLLWKRVEAVDITAAFTDLEHRVNVARWARERLLQLLEREKDVNERLRILAEVKRQTELIESIEAQLATYRNLVDYFTLFIELEPVVADVATVEHRSPFAWVRGLVAHSQTIRDSGGEVSLSLPAGFVLFDEEDDYVARAADTTILRAGRVDNEPRGDSEFWAKALDFEMEGRDEERLETGAIGTLVYRVYRDKDMQPRTFLVAVVAMEEDLWVIEVFFPNEAAWQAHGAAVKQALSSFEVK